MAAKKLKSIHITNYYHEESGGISTVYNHLLEAANRHEREVRLIVPGGFDRQEERGEFGRVYFVKAGKSPVFDRRYRIIKPWHYIPQNSVVRRILEQEKPEIIEVAEKYVLSYLGGHVKKGFLKSLGRPMLVHLTCERMDDNLRAFISRLLPGWLSRKVMGNYIAPMFDYHIANSDYTARELLNAVSNGNSRHRFQDFCWRFFNSSEKDFDERVFVSHCGVDSEFFRPGRKNPEARRRLLAKAGFPEDATVLLYAGRLSPEKNLKLLPKVLRSLVAFLNFDSSRRTYRLLVAGNGPQAAWLEEKLQSYAPGKFKLLGHVGDKDELADLYANSDIFIHTNPREPFGIAPLEAMASGTPVIVPNSGGVLSYANKENAWVIEPTIEDYFAAAREIFNNPEKRERKIRNALETARNFSWERSTDRIFRLYDDLYYEFRTGQGVSLNGNNNHRGFLA
ncbi:MAG: glycosyltransferase [Acidobacteria bacterium]|nr:glycosyltransferase [Acidobacteriota bacterium]